MYTELRLKIITGQHVAIRVDPPFDAGDLDYFPGIRAVSLGNLTVLYEGLVYDVCPSGRVVGYDSSRPVQRLKSEASRPN